MNAFYLDKTKQCENFGHIYIALTERQMDRQNLIHKKKMVQICERT